MSMVGDPYLELAAAIVKTGILDYRAAYRHLLKHPDSKAARDAAEREKKFFYSSWFEMLSEMDGPTLVAMIEQKVKAEMKEKGGDAQ